MNQPIFSFRFSERSTAHQTLRFFPVGCVNVPLISIEGRRLVEEHILRLLIAFQLPFPKVNRGFAKLPTICLVVGSAMACIQTEFDDWKILWQIHEILLDLFSVLDLESPRVQITHKVMSKIRFTAIKESYFLLHLAQIMSPPRIDDAGVIDPCYLDPRVEHTA